MTANRSAHPIPAERKAALRGNLMRCQSVTSHHDAYASAQRGNIVEIGDFVKVLKGAEVGSMLLEKHFLTVTGDCAHRVVDSVPPHILLEIPNYGQGYV